MRLSNKILLASLNREKFEEFTLLFSAYPEIELMPASAIIRNPEGLKYAEKHDTYLDNAVAKARLANLASHYPSLADDSGIEVTALSGRPGVHSHRYAPPRAGFSQDQVNMELLLKEVGNAKDRSARFVCTLALIVEGVMLHATGILEGTLLTAPRGTLGFGYDPIFVPKGSTLTLAEMTSKEKNVLSHRGRALQELMNQVTAYDLALAKP